MGARRFDDLRAWQLAAELSDKVVALCATKALQTDVKFRYQLQDAAEAAPRLIAEGFGRWSPRDFARYLVMARSEVMEVISDLMALRCRTGVVVKDQGRIDRNICNALSHSWCGWIVVFINPADIVKNLIARRRIKFVCLYIRVVEGMI